MDYAPERMVFEGVLNAHTGGITSLATSPNASAMLVSASRDNSMIVWDIDAERRRSQEAQPDDINRRYGFPHKRLSGHGHFVQDVALSFDGAFALSGSWDKTARLWDLSTGECAPTFDKKKHFDGHTNDVLSVAFSADNRQIITGSRDRTIRLWNTRGQCKYIIGGEGKHMAADSSAKDDGHKDWVSCVRFSPNVDFNVFVSAGWDKKVKVWNSGNCKLQYNLNGHTGSVNTVTVSPDSSLCASGGKDGVAMLWDLKEGKHLYSLEAGAEINSMCFSPNRYWLCAATPESIIIWDLESKQAVERLVPDFGDVKYKGRRGTKPQCTSLAWGDANGETLFAGYADGIVRVWKVQGSS